MINVFSDGFSTFQNHFWMIIPIFLVIIWGQIVMSKILSKIFDNQFNDDEYFSLSLSGWVFPVFIWAGIYFLINILSGRIIASIISIIVFFIPFLLIKLKKISPTIFYLSSFLLISFFLRLVFLQQAIFPAYFDSAQHYQNIQNIISIYESSSSSLFRFNYYHLGYHFISAALIQFFQFNEINFMLVFGQIVLTILPLSFFFLMKQITQSNTVAFFTFLIAAFGFHMPAHLINWGKYPALLSLAGFQFVFCLGYIAVKREIIQKSKLYWLISLVILITTLIHTRTLIAFALLVISLFITLQLKKLPARFQYTSFIFLFIVLGIEFFYIHQRPVLLPLISGYTQRDLWSLILVLLITPFSIKLFPNSTFFLLTSLSLFLFLLFFPISISNYGTQTLLDRPFIQMLGYIPLSVIIGLGFAGLLKVLQEFKPLTYGVSSILFAFLIFNVKVNYSFYPSDCCQLAREDDLSAIEWIDKEQPSDVRILIASNPLYVTSFESIQSLTGADAGIWITPLTSRFTLLAPTNLNFEDPQTLSSICNQQIKLIYIGSMPQSFNKTQLKNHPTWYEIVFSLPNVQIYEVNCQ